MKQGFHTHLGGAESAGQYTPASLQTSVSLPSLLSRRCCCCCRDAMHRVSTVHAIPVMHAVPAAARRRQASNSDNPLQAAGAARGKGSPAARTAKQFNCYAVVERGRALYPELRSACTGLY
jgi:hypothetical protein